MEHIKILAGRCRALISILAVLWIIAVPVIWLSNERIILSVWNVVVGAYGVGITLDTGIRCLGMLLSLLPLAVILYITWLLRALLKHYQQGEFFILSNVHLIRKLGFSLYLWAASNIIFKTLLSLILTLNNPPHEHLLTISISGMDIQSIIIASVIILLSWVMIEAQKLSEDNALIP